MHDARRTMAISLVVALALLFTFGLGAITSYVLIQPEPVHSSVLPTSTAGTSSSNNPSTPADLDEQMKVFNEAMELLKEEYYGNPVDTQKMIYAAAKSAFESLNDPPTMFVEPVTNEMLESDIRGNFEGIGAYVEMREGGLAIVSPMPGSPAEAAGLRANDLVTHVDGRDIRGMSETDAIQLVRGPANSTVTLTIQRGTDAPFDVQVTRATIEIPAVTTTMRDDGIGVLAVSVFGDKTVTELDAGLKEIMAKNPKGIILDLRNNGGGYVESAQEMIGRFVSPDTGKKYDDTALYYSYNKEGTNIEALQIKRGDSNTPHAYDVPLVVLGNGGTASASELTTAALLDYGRAILIGEQTYGKGSVQNVHQLSDGSSVRVTIAHWLSPNKRDINPLPTQTPDPAATATPVPTATPTNATPAPSTHPILRDRGLTPNIEVIRTDDDYANQRDPQLDRAVQYLLTGK